MMSVLTKLSMGLGAAALVALAGCSQQQHTESKPVQKTEAKPAPAPMMAMSSARMYFPSGDKASSALLVEEMLPASVRAGQPFEGMIKVTNITGADLQNVMVDASGFSNYALTGSTPAGNKTASGMQWALGTLAPGASSVIKLNGSATAVGTAGNCLGVSYNNALCVKTNVVQPALAIKKSMMPAEGTPCDPITAVIEVTNTGSGEATNVMVKDALPAGLMTADGKSSVEIAAGTLAAGETKKFPMTLKASKTGKFDNAASVMADGGLKAESNTVSTVIKQAVLAVECKAPQQVFTGRDVNFDVTVKNTGDMAATGNLALTMPAGATIVKGNEDKGMGFTLAPGASKTYNLTVKPAGMGSVSLTATANAPCAAAATSTCSSTVIGIPAMLLDGVDDPDPIAMGETTTYTLKITNQGSVDLTNVKLVTSMMDADKMAYVSSSGGTANGATINFPAIPVLKPKQSQTFTVVVKATGAGQVQFKAEATSDQITKGLIKIETTNFYQ